jgi:hypothetical protein
MLREIHRLDTKGLMAIGFVIGTAQRLMEYAEKDMAS